MHSSAQYFLIFSFQFAILMRSTIGAEVVSKEYTTAELTQGRKAALDFHNLYRKWHGSVPMTLNEKLNKGAQSYAEFLMNAGGGMKHSPVKERPNQGENLFNSSRSGEKGKKFSKYDLTAPGKKSVTGWYFEICDPKFKTSFSHFSQLVWNNSVELGIGIAVNEAHTKVVVVGRYSPAGNVQGAMDKMVGPLRCKNSDICDGKNRKKPKGKEYYEEGDCKGTGDRIKIENIFPVLVIQFIMILSKWI